MDFIVLPNIDLFWWRTAPALVGMLVLTGADGGRSGVRGNASLYLIRLAGFVLIIVGIVDKNRQVR